ncbi:MAG: YetF domain-containing protein [Pyrinomonadaceae bacterium]
MFIDFHLIAFADSAWQNMFAIDPEKVTWIEKVIRPILIYATLVAFLRLFGKRELAQLNPFDLVVLLTLSNTVQNAIIGDDTSVSGGVVGALTLLALNYGVSFLKFKNKKIEAVIEGRPLTIIEDGKVNKKALRRELLTKEDLDILAHREGLENSDDIDKCILDPNGSFLVDGKDEVKDGKFKKDVLDKIDKLSKQINDLQKALQKA